MSRKRNVVDRNKIAEKMSTYMMLMGYIGDYRYTASKELSRRIWKRDSRLSKKRIRRLQHLLCAVDSEALLAFTVSLGKLVWSDNLKVKRRMFEKRLSEKVRLRSIMKKVRRGKPGRVTARKGCGIVKKQKGNVVGPKFVTGFHMRPVRGSTFKLIVCHKRTGKQVKPAFGSVVYRLAMSMNVLCYRNVCITSDWELSTVCFVKQICGFWRSVAIADNMSSSLVSVAMKFGLCVVSPDLLERMESCFECSSSARYLVAGSWLTE